LISLWRIILRVDFYHLTRSPVEGVLPMLAEKTVAAGGRLLVVAESGERLDRLDEALWTFRANSFLPHARSDGGEDSAQPILLHTTVEPVNMARTIALADGKWRNEALAFDRALFLFTPEVIDDARGAWRRLGESGHVERHYWKQTEGGKWVEGP
jgi:DNA polymerase III subunit chi